MTEPREHSTEHDPDVEAADAANGEPGATDSAPLDSPAGASEHRTGEQQAAENAEDESPA